MVTPKSYNYPRPFRPSSTFRKVPPAADTPLGRRGGPGTYLGCSQKMRAGHLRNPPGNGLNRFFFFNGGRFFKKNVSFSEVRRSGFPSQSVTSNFNLNFLICKMGANYLFNISLRKLRMSAGSLLPPNTGRFWKSGGHTKYQNNVSYYLRFCHYFHSHPLRKVFRNACILCTGTADLRPGQGLGASHSPVLPTSRPA